MEIKIKNAVLHILDSNVDIPILSKNELNLEDNQIVSLIEMYIKKTLEDTSLKSGTFLAESYIPELFEKLEGSFIEASILIAKNLFEIMIHSPNIPVGDLLICNVFIDGSHYLAILKLNYKKGYTHFVDYMEDGTVNKIINYKVILPSETQKIDEGAIINIKDNTCVVLEKKLFINGEKINYFSELFLKCKTDLSNKESINILRTAAQEVVHKYYQDAYKKSSLVNKVIYDSLEEEGMISIDRVADTVFADDENVKTEYLKKIQDAGVNNSLKFNGNTPEKNFRRYKIKTDNGIELSIPMQIYQNKNVIEFINNPDGTVSIIIKQINSIK